MMKRMMRYLLVVLLWNTISFLTNGNDLFVTALNSLSSTNHHHHHHDDSPNRNNHPSRRNVLVETTMTTCNTMGLFLVGMMMSSSSPLPAFAAANQNNDFASLKAQLIQASKQMESIPKLIDSEKWDSVRAILIEPPLSDCWARTNRPLLGNFAEALGDAGGDELAVLEVREELVSHLRFLDMAVYNNVFNPIKTEGTNGATKALVRSYYEDPINEFKASKAGLDELVKLANDL